MTLACLVELCGVQLLQVFLFFQVFVEAGKFGPQAQDVVHFTHQDVIELFDVVFDIALRFFNVLKNAHILLNNVDYVVNMLTVL